MEPRGNGVLAEKIDLNSMSADELWSLHEEISEILSAHILEEKRELEKRLAILNRGADIIKGSFASRAAPNGKPRRKYPKVLPRYRNPETFETWSGRGKRPRWLVVAMEAGHDVEEFLIASQESRNLFHAHRVGSPGTQTTRERTERGR